MAPLTANGPIDRAPTRNRADETDLLCDEIGDEQNDDERGGECVEILVAASGQAHGFRVGSYRNAVVAVPVCSARCEYGQILTLKGYIVSVDAGEGAAGTVILAASLSSSPAQDTALSRR